MADIWELKKVLWLESRDYRRRLLRILAIGGETVLREEATRKSGNERICLLIDFYHSHFTHTRALTRNAYLAVTVLSSCIILTVYYVQLT